jgi:hypothetical protein
MPLGVELYTSSRKQGLIRVHIHGVGECDADNLRDPILWLSQAIGDVRDAMTVSERTFHAIV